MIPTDVRFWKYVDKNGPTVRPELGPCWIWTGSRYPFGHGQFYFDGKLRFAHRFSWELQVGKIPDGLFVLHKCDVPSCINVAHLFIGTKVDNARDMIAKGRRVYQRKGPRKAKLDVNRARGESHHNAKLNEQNVLEIREHYRQGLSCKNIGRLYGVGVHCIHGIIALETWKHVA